MKSLYNPDNSTNELIFNETQKFKQWWIGFILLCVNGIFIFGIYKQLILRQQFGDKPMGNIGLTILSGITITLAILFWQFRLETRVTKEGITVRFFPFHLNFKHYSWETISKSYIREYSPIKEFGGWGLKKALDGNGKAFNVS